MEKTSPFCSLLPTDTTLHAYRYISMANGQNSILLFHQLRPFATGIFNLIFLYSKCKKKKKLSYVSIIIYPSLFPTASFIPITHLLSFIITILTVASTLSSSQTLYFVNFSIKKKLHIAIIVVREDSEMFSLQFESQNLHFCTSCQSRQENLINPAISSIHEKFDLFNLIGTLLEHEIYYHF